MKGGVSTGFHHISAPPPLDLHRLYKVSFSRVAGRSNLVVREVLAKDSSLVEGDVFVLDKGRQVWQFNTKTSIGQEKFKAAEFVQSLANDRQGQCEVTVYGQSIDISRRVLLGLTNATSDEGGQGAGLFLSELGADTLRPELQPVEVQSDLSPSLFRLSDSSGTITFEPVNPIYSSLSSADAFLLDHASHLDHPAIFVWLGSDSSLVEQRLAIQYAHKYLSNKQQNGERVLMTVPLIKMNQGSETKEFLHALGA